MNLPAPPAPPALARDKGGSWEMAVITVGLVVGAIFLIEVLFGLWSPLDLFR